MRLMGLALLALLASGCCSTSKDGLPSDPPPTAEKAISAFNAELGRLEKIWARTNVRITTVDEGGDTVIEQGEGYLQAVLPDRVLLSAGKYVDRQYVLLGAGAGDYWYFDMRDGVERSAIVGKSDEVTPEIARRFGAPVHPLDLVDLLALAPLPEDSNASSVWSRTPSGEIVVALEFNASRGEEWGTRRVYLETQRFLPVRIELIDASGELAASNDLKNHVGIQTNLFPQPVLAMNHAIELPLLETSVTIGITAIEQSPRRPRPSRLTLDEQLDIYAIPARNIRRAEEIEPANTRGLQ